MSVNNEEMSEPLLARRFYEEEQLEPLVPAEHGRCEKCCVFGLEICLLLGLVGASAIFVSALALPYFVVGLVLLNQIHDYSRSVLTCKHRLLLATVLYSALLFFLKLAACLLLFYGVFTPPSFARTLGLAVAEGGFQWRDWLFTLSPDVAAWVSGMILIGLNLQIRKFAAAEAGWLGLPRKLLKQHKVWCYLDLLLLCGFVCTYPCALSLFFLLVLQLGLVLWLCGVKVEDRPYRALSPFVFWLSLADLLAGYVLYVDWFRAQRISESLLRFLGVPLLANQVTLWDLLEFVLLLAILSVCTIYQQTARDYRRKKQAEKLLLREQLLRDYGRALQGEREATSLFRMADQVHQARRLHNEVHRAKIAGTYTQDKELQARFEGQEDAGEQLHSSIGQLLRELGDRKRNLMLPRQGPRAPGRSKGAGAKKAGSLSACGYLVRLVGGYLASFEFFLLLGRGGLLVWVMMYSSLPCLPLLVFLLHSLLYRAKKQFACIVAALYLPYLLALVLFHIAFQGAQPFLFPGLVQPNFDLRPARIYFLETAFKLSTLLVVAVALKLSPRKVAPPALPDGSSVVLQLAIELTRHLRALLLLLVFAVGVSRVDIYHLLLLGCYSCFAVSARCMERAFPFFQLLLALFPLSRFLLLVLRAYYHSAANTQWLTMLGLLPPAPQPAPDSASYFLYQPDLLLWLLLAGSFLQTRSYVLHAQHRRGLHQLERRFYDAHPACMRCLYLLWRFWQLYLVWLAHLVVLVLLLLDHKSLAELLIWACAALNLLAALAPSYKRAHAPPPCIWGWRAVLVATAAYVLSLCAFQLLFLDSFAFLLDQVPAVVLHSADFLGYFQIPSGELITHHLSKLAIMLISALAYATLHAALQQSAADQPDQAPHFRADSEFPGAGAINLSVYERGPEPYPQHVLEGEDEPPRLEEYCGERIDTQYFVLKARWLWPVLDLLCGSFFEVLAGAVLVLSILFRFCFGFFVQLLVLALHYGQLHAALARLNVGAVASVQGALFFSNFEKAIEDRANTVVRTDFRSRYWGALALWLVLLLLLAYPSQFLYAMLQVRELENFAGALQDSIWFSFLLGTSYAQPTVASFFYYCWGYLLVLLLLVLERKAQAWTYNRYGVDENSSVKIERVPRQELLSKKRQQRLTRDLRRSTTYLKAMGRTPSAVSSLSRILEERSSGRPEDQEQEEEEAEAVERKEARRKLRQKYCIGILHGVKYVAENTLVYFVVVAGIVKANVFSLLYLLALFLLQLCVRNSTQKMRVLTQIVGALFCLQYLVMLSNLNALTSPLPLPPYHVGILSQWYTRISSDPEFIAVFSYYFQLGSERIQVACLWYEVLILWLLALYFHLFCYKYFQIPQRQLFSDLKGQPRLHTVEEVAAINTFLRSLGLGPISKRLARTYLDGEARAYGRQATRAVPAGRALLKREMAPRDWYKALRKVVYVFMHIFTLCLILTLAVQDSSLISCVYIVFAFYYIFKTRSFYEEAGPQGWWFPRLLQWFLLPYIMVDLLVQMLFQMPLGYFFHGSAIPSSLLNLLGIFSIWEYNKEGELVIHTAVVWVLVLKGLIFIVIVVQLHIFSSDEYKVFIYKDLNRNKGFNRVRGQAMSYSYNNDRLRACCEQTANKKNLVQNLAILREKLNHLWSASGSSFRRLPTALEAELFKKSVMLMGASEKAAHAEASVDLEDDEQVYHAAIAQAPSSVKLFIWINKNMTNPLMIQGGDILEKSRNLLYLGAEKVRSDIEYYMIDDYRAKHIYERELAAYEQAQTQQLRQNSFELIDDATRGNTFILPKHKSSL